MAKYVEVPLDEAIAHLGIEHVRGPFYKCPACGHRSLKVKDDGKVYFCHHGSCAQGGGSVQLAMIVWDLPIKEAAKRLREELGYPEITVDTADTLLTQIDVLEAGDEGVDPDEIEHVKIAVQMYWHKAASACRYVRERYGGKVDEDVIFHPLWDAVAGGVVTEYGQAITLGRQAYDRLTRALEEGTGEKLPVFHLPRITFPAEIRMTIRLEKSRMAFYETCLAKKADISVVQLLELGERHDAIRRAEWNRKST